MRFKKIYVEITNACNFNCSFCFQSKRKKMYMSPEVFSAILFSIRPYTNYIYLHVLGEPLLHPHINELLSIAEEQGFFINMTTNGSLLAKRKEILVQHKIRQYNISLHDAEENLLESEWGSYLENVTSFAQNQSESSYFSLRLWNEGSESSIRYNQFCEAFLQEKFAVELMVNCRNLKLADHIYLQRSSRFGWPGGEEKGEERRNCYALRDHIAVLSDGTVVPCCLDADGNMALGNILQESLETILQKERTQHIAEGFRQHRVVESFCKTCGFIMPNI